MTTERKPPGRVRDAIVDALAAAAEPLTVREIRERVEASLGPTPSSSIRSYLRLNTPGLFERSGRGRYGLHQGDAGAVGAHPHELHPSFRTESIGSATLVHGDGLAWLEAQAANTIHAVVTDPPYGLHEYSAEQQAKLRNGKGGVWRIPPAFDGRPRSPLPRFTTLTDSQLVELRQFFVRWGQRLLPVVVPGAHVVVASNPLLSYIVSGAMSEAGFERRGEIARLVMTMRGGDRPKSAHDEFPEVSVMARSMWEPWLVYRKPIGGRVADNLRRWGTGGFRRPSGERPFGDVIPSSPTHKRERALAPHPSLKPQAFLRQVVRAVLPLGKGVVLDPFAGAGSTLAACEAVGYSSIGVEKDAAYFALACEAIPKLTRLEVPDQR